MPTFNIEEYVSSKVALLKDYFNFHGITAVVIGISGGVDSAVAMHLLNLCNIRVVPVIAPIHNTKGVIGQDEATRLARIVCTQAWLQPKVIDLSGVQKEYEYQILCDPWIAGQIASIARTPAFYGVAAQLQVQGWKAVVSGTTNRSEGSYIGFFGKASDGMCDIQPISDLWKSQVYALAHYFSVPEEIVNREPTGDCYDGRVDVEMIGAPYWFLEKYLETGKCEDVAQCLWAKNIEEIHMKNAHKYLVGSPAVHFDVLPRHIPGGWSAQNTYSHKLVVVPTDLPGQWSPPEVRLNFPTTYKRTFTAPVKGSALEMGIVETLTPGDCEILRNMFKRANKAPVGVSGYIADTTVGSMRATAWSPRLAKQLWEKLNHSVQYLLGRKVCFEDNDPTDWFERPDRKQHRIWYPSGISPVLRFMEYKSGGKHNVHYDMGFDYEAKDPNNKRRTLMSVVWYLTSNYRGGETVFVDDGQSHLPMKDRDLNDWTRTHNESEVFERFSPREGHALLFWHRQPHGVSEFLPSDPNDTRIIIRGDIEFTALD